MVILALCAYTTLDKCQIYGKNEKIFSSLLAHKIISAYLCIVKKKQAKIDISKSRYCLG